MPTCEITIYIEYQSTGHTNFSLLISLGIIEELDRGVGNSPQRDPPLSMLQSLVTERDGIFFQHMHKIALC